jgi:hypothetical protein
MINGPVWRGKNNYYFVEDGDLKPVDEFGDSYDRSGYFRHLIETIENDGALQGFDFVITIRDMNDIPIKGSNTIVIIIGEERFYSPSYASDVLAIFRCMGPNHREVFPLRSDYIGLLIGLRELRRHLFMLPRGVRSMFSHAITGKRSAPVYRLPMGYSSKAEQPPPAIETRPYDVSFIGSINPYLENSRTFRDLVGTPKSISRHRMLENLTRYSKANPERHIHVELTSDFGASMRSGAEHFNDILRKSKICLAPRGGSAETTRFYQGMLCGCVVISEPLPPFWFYEDAPAVFLEDWRKLGTVLDDLLSCPQRLNQLSSRTRQWWNTQCSETVVAQFIAERVMAIRHGSSHEVGASAPEGKDSALEC